MRHLRASLASLLLLILLSACATAQLAPGVEATSAPKPQATKVVTQEVEKVVTPVVEAAPGTPQPTSAPAVSEATQPPASPAEPIASSATPAPASPTAQPAIRIEGRVIELEWPATLRLGDTDVIRLALIPSADGYTVTTEFPEHQTVTQTLQVARPEGFELHAIARLDTVSFDLAPEAEQSRLLPENEGVDWRWTISPRRAGQQRLAISLVLRWSSLPGSTGLARETLAYSNSLDIQVGSFFGLNRSQAMTGGALGLLLGGVLSAAAVVGGARHTPSELRRFNPNPTLVLEPLGGMTLEADEQRVLRALFKRYTRLAILGEFLSGYSGARTLLARPIRPDGRADADTIIKLGQRQAIEREFHNYQTFVKDTLPPITARIQQPPVAAAEARLGHEPRGRQIAALQYTFIGAPGQPPASLRQALLAESDPAQLEKLFASFGPNWWMQRHPYTFRLALEYDRMLPTHLVIAPAVGKGSPLDGSLIPTQDANLPKIGDLVTLRNFRQAERRPDGRSLSVWGHAAPGQPALRVRWMLGAQPFSTGAGTAPPNGATGRVIATRQSLLNQSIAGFDLFDLPDPLAGLAARLAETVSGTRAVIHGDLNLENILVGPGGFVWLIDFAQTREGHTLFDFAHLEAEVIAHVIAPQTPSLEAYRACLEAPLDRLPPACRLRTTIQAIAWRCLFNPSQPREYTLALNLACLGALKFTNLNAHAKHLLYLTAAHTVKLLEE